jgi:hypothetical protein
MSFLRTQNIKRDAQNNIISGSASIMNTVYDNTRAHKSKQVVLEKLGKVLWLSENGRSGIFLNPQRGLFHYDSSTGEFSSVPSDDPRLPREMDEKPVRHVVFGTTDLFLHFLEKLGYTEMLKNIFPTKPDFQRVICHLAHKFLKDGSHVHVDDFIERTLLSYYATDISTGSLRCDTRYFTMMGDERVKIAFFRELVKMYRKSSPDFGKCCLIDSTPLPNDIDNNPFNALSCHGIGGAAEQTRQVLVLDKDTGIPVWYELIPGNVLDINTLTQIRNAVMEFLELEIAEYTLDAGYCSKLLIQEFFPGPTDKGGQDISGSEDAGVQSSPGQAEGCEQNSLGSENGGKQDNHGSDDDSQKTPGNLIVRMPARRGYPYKKLYHSKKNLFGKGKYLFTNEKHTYFGIREEAEIFGRTVNAYVYVDKENALTGFRNFLSEHGEDYDAMPLAEKDYKTVEHGYFVLLSTYVMEPKALLMEYFARTDIEGIFKTAKNYLDLLPLAKWTDRTVRGKILSDMIVVPIYLQARLQVNKANKSMTSAIGAMDASICLVNNQKRITVDYPTKKIKEIQDSLKLTQESNIVLDEYFKEMKLVI